MAKFVKAQSGLLYNENFAEHSLLWSLTPNIPLNVEFTENGLRMIHNKEYTIYSINEPDTDDFSCICHFDHIPYNTNDIVGVLVMADSENYVEAQSYIDNKKSGYNSLVTMKDYVTEQIKEQLDVLATDYVRYTIQEEENVNEETKKSIEEEITTNNDDSNKNEESYSYKQEESSSSTFVDVIYHYVKISKTNGNLYTFYASEDGYSWIEFGNASFKDAGRIGFFTYGTNNQDMIDNSHFYIKNFCFYSDKYLVITGLKDGQTFELKNDNHILCTSFSQIVNQKNNIAVIDTTTLPMPITNGKILLKDADGQVIVDNSFDFLVGGDRYSFSYDIHVCINNKEINKDDLIDLGVFYTNNQTARLYIYNDEEYEIKNLKVKIIAYSEYYGGSEPIEISVYHPDQITTEFKKEIIIDSIMPSEGKSILVRLSKKIFQPNYKSANDFRFKIIIE